MAIYDINGNDLTVIPDSKRFIGGMKPESKYTIELLASIPNVLLRGAQGLAITGDTLAMLLDGGGIYLWDIPTQTAIGYYMMDIAATDTHANSATFSTEMGTTYPLLYISECKGSKRCFVEDIGTSSSSVVQTISFTNSNMDYTSYFDWILDIYNSKIMTFGISGTKKLIKVFDLPSTGTESVTLTESDVLDHWIVDESLGEPVNTYQGNCVYGNILYLPCSNSERLLAFDKTTHALIGKINLSADYPSFPEVEDVAVYNGDLILQTNNRLLYRIKFYS